jgi:hypothetical protein
MATKDFSAGPIACCAHSMTESSTSPTCNDSERFANQRTRSQSQPTNVSEEPAAIMLANAPLGPGSLVAVESNLDMAVRAAATRLLRVQTGNESSSYAKSAYE